MRRVLIVANRTAGTPDLLAAVERRAAAERTGFTLLIPEVKRSKNADWTLEQALTALRKAAAGETRSRATHVDGRVTGLDPLASIKAALAEERYDEVLISTLPARRSLWLRTDLPAEARKLGVPVTVVSAPEEARMGLKDLPVIGGPS
ncbi:hypothetical protein DVA67_028150 [Solirubrobacter sp. CPCC 204708]|uniref:Universal stress protein n=1 Tax=Solirubrobacter deserti TaxID=2282478 RepID=A0ABT4RSP0_9ACTN|nr:hypothetical protein [Solirubrobacter deserti]MBE2319870.1 hypothetical protein [Solirubrobacter deserti]MDA0141403.1 hypothetical protein [Solirubrobacter deserti]